MPPCSKCHRKEATVHFTTIMGGVEETVHLCRDCAPPMGLPTLDPKELAALSVTGKKCEFCGRDAVSGALGATGPVYWCFDCGLEHSRILGELSASERPDLMQRANHIAGLEQWGALPIIYASTSAGAKGGG